MAAARDFSDYTSPDAITQAIRDSDPTYAFGGALTTRSGVARRPADTSSSSTLRPRAGSSTDGTGGTGGTGGSGAGGSGGTPTTPNAPDTPDEIAYDAIANALASLGTGGASLGGSAPLVTMPVPGAPAASPLRAVLVLGALGVAGWLGWRYYRSHSGE